MEKERCDPVLLLKKAGIKATSSRLRVLEALLDIRCAFSAKDLRNALVEAGASIDVATIYRTLQLFLTRGLLRSVGVEGGAERFASTCSHNPLHAHFVCERCGKTFCLRAFGFEDTRNLLSLLEPGFIVHDVSLSFRGRCAECSGTERNDSA